MVVAGCTVAEADHTAVAAADTDTAGMVAHLVGCTAAEADIDLAEDIDPAAGTAADIAVVGPAADTAVEDMAVGPAVADTDTAGKVVRPADCTAVVAGTASADPAEDIAAVDIVVADIAVEPVPDRKVAARMAPMIHQTAHSEQNQVAVVELLAVATNLRSKLRDFQTNQVGSTKPKHLDFLGFWLPLRSVFRSSP